MSWSRSVFSSMINEIGFDEEAGGMTVTFSNGSVFLYDGVDEETAERLSRAPSVGQAFNAEIKGQYSYRKIG